MATLSRSTHFDWRLAPYDLAGSRAHARALHRAGLLTDNELTAMLDGLELLSSEVTSGVSRPTETDEDVHGALERRLVELVGAELGGRLRAGRSRNDQIATLIRMYLRDALRAVTLGLRDVVGALNDQARDHLGVAMPGRTHLQHAQPVLFAHHLLAYVEMLERDAERLADAARRADRSPAGSGAVAGSGLALDRARIAAELGFAGVTDNSIDAIHTNRAFQTRVFQLYDGTVCWDGCTRMLWHDVDLRPERLQLIPKRLRYLPGTERTARILTAGTVDCITEDDLERKLGSGRSLRVKLAGSPWVSGWLASFTTSVSGDATPICSAAAMRRPLINASAPRERFPAPRPAHVPLRACRAISFLWRARASPLPGLA